MGPEGDVKVVESGSGPDVPEQLSGVAVVIIIAVGVQTFIMLFIFAKRQIMRFTLRSRRGPHVSVGQGGVKAFRREIDRRLDYASHIKHEPKLCRDKDNSVHQLRMLAVDKISELDDVVARYGAEYVRPAGANLRSFLIECLAGPLVGSDPRQVHLLCDMYEHARHSHNHFGQLEYNNYINLLSELKNLVTANTKNKPEYKKLETTPLHKPVNRPRKRVEAQALYSTSLGSSVLVQRNSSTTRLVSTSHDNSVHV